MRTRVVGRDYLYGDKLTKMLDKFVKTFEKAEKAFSSSKDKRICKRVGINSSITYSLHYEGGVFKILSDCDIDNPSIYVNNDNNSTKSFIIDVVTNYYMKVYGNRYKNIKELPLVLEDMSV